MENAYFAHESSFVDNGAAIGQGTKIWHFSHLRGGCSVGKNCNIGQNIYIDSGVIVGDNVKIQNNVSLYSGVVVENDVFLGPSCVFTNVINPRSFIERKDEFRKTIIGRGASIGANATIVCGNSIGKYAFVGAGSVITKGVPDYALVYGAPAKIMGYVCKCGNKLDFNEDIATCVICSGKYVMDSKKTVKDTKND